MTQVDMNTHLQNQVSQLQIQINQLQTQNASQSLIIKNLSSMIKLLHSDFQTIKQDNRQLKRVIYDLTNGDPKYFSNTKGEPCSEPSTVNTTSNGNERNDGLNGHENGYSQGTGDFQNEHSNGPLHVNTNFKNQANNPHIHSKSFTNKVYSKNYQNGESKNTIFTPSSEDDMESPFEIFSGFSFMESTIPDSTTSTNGSVGVNITETTPSNNAKMSIDPNRIPKDQNFSNTTSSVANNPQSTFEKQFKEHSLGSSSIFDNHTSPNIANLEKGENIETTYAYSGTKIDEKTFDPSQPEASCKKPETPTWKFMDRVLGTSRNRPKNESFEKLEENSRNSTPNSNSIRSPFIHTRFEKFINKRTARAHSTGDVTRGSSFASELASGGFNSSPKTPKTPKETQQAPSSFNPVFSSSIFKPTININSNSKDDSKQSESGPTNETNRSSASNASFQSFNSEAPSDSKSQQHSESYYKSSKQEKTSRSTRSKSYSSHESPFNTSKKYHYFSYSIDSDSDDEIQCELNKEGKKLYDEARYGEAYAKFTESLLRNADNTAIKANIYFKRAFIALKMMKNHSLCLAEASKAIDCNKHHYKSYLCRGDCFIAMKEYEKAVNDFRMARNLRYTDVSRSRLKYAKRLLKDKMEKSEKSSTFDFETGYDSFKQSHSSFNRSFSSKASAESAFHDFTSIGGNKENHESFNSSQIETPKNVHNDKTFYDILGIPNHTNDSNLIKKAYKKLARQWHPDRFIEDETGKIEAEEIFKEISKAYRILKDDKEKLKYDTILLRKRRKRSYSSYL